MLLLLLVAALGGLAQRSTVEAMLALADVTQGDLVFLIGQGHEDAGLAADRGGWRLVRVPVDASATVDLAAASIVMLDVPRAQLEALAPRLRRELSEGARVVARGFAIDGWEPAGESLAPDGTRLFLWRVPRRPAREPDILFVPTREAVADQMLRLAGITPDDIVYDLGSGDGRIVNLAAQKYGARGVGIEIDPPLVERARAIAKEAGIEDRVTFVEADLFHADLSNATVVTLYLSPSVNRKLEAKLRRELRPGTRVVSHQFPIGTWPPDETVRAEDRTELYLWIVRDNR
jgi:hypothetical protein